MEPRYQRLLTFLYGTYFYHGLRRGIGLFLAIIVWFGLTKHYDYGFAFCAAVLCMSFCDSPTSYYLAGVRELLTCAILITVGCTITFYVLPYPFISWLVVSVIVFWYSMLAVYGGVGILISFSAVFCVLMALTGGTPAPGMNLMNSLLVAAGCLYYFLYAAVIGFFLRRQLNRQLVANAINDTAKFVALRARLYDVNVEIGSAYSALINHSPKLLASHRAARELVLRNLPEGRYAADQTRIRLWNIYYQINKILDTLVATHPDYELLRKELGNHDALLFMRDTMLKLSKTLEEATLDLLTHKPFNYRNSVKAELRALEYEVEHFKRADLARTKPELYQLLVQLQRRLRNTAYCVNAVADNLKREKVSTIDKIFNHQQSLQSLRTRNPFTLQKIFSNLTLSSGVFRYSLRLTAAVIIVLMASSLLAYIPMEDELRQNLYGHVNWILFTVLLVIRPGFATTYKRSNWRIAGTIIGCLVTILILALVHNTYVIMSVLLVAMVLGHTFTPMNLKLGSVFTTMYILIGFYLLTPDFYWLVGQRFFDTIVACLLGFAFSFLLPRWEKDVLPKLTLNNISALRNYLFHALEYLKGAQNESAAAEPDKDDPEFVEMQISRKNTHASYAAMYDSYKNMLQEPKGKQIEAVPLDIILRQTEHMVSQISAVTALILELGMSAEVERSLRHVLKTLDLQHSLDEPAPPVDNSEQYVNLRFPVKLMYSAASQIREAALKLNFTEPPKTPDAESLTDE